MGINDLVDDWLGGSTPEDAILFSGDPHREGIASAAEDILKIARTAWHPISEPPTKFGVEYEMVLVWKPQEQTMEWCVWDMVERLHSHDQGTKWARWHDVVLLPEDK